MAFVNEYIPADDFKKYGFEQLNRRTSRGSTPNDFWVIDREMNIWLRKFYSEMDHTAVRGGYTGVSAWDFYWKGNLIWVEVKDGDGGGGYGQPRWQQKKLLRIDIPAALEVQRSQILADLVAAFTAYKGAGVFATDSEFSFTLEM
jgi:hypothetical protein